MKWFPCVATLRRLATVLCACAAALFVAGCAGTPVLEVAAEDWKYQDRAVTLQVESASDLNVLSGRPHSLVIGLFQMSDPGTFQGLATTQEGAIQLLNEGRIDGTIASFDRIIVQPGQTKTEVLPRAQGAQFVGVVVGYFGLSTELDIRIVEIPVKPARRGAVDLVLANLGLVANEAKAVPDVLYLSLSLGRNNTNKVEIIRSTTVETI
ncbi:type VI secretion system lipoprotein TssJ [Saccharospirillum alexandrii]|uniref:type VI secretion system lipoprotein TssJ n=1 Tax=Saccharospirillum alexandrii TaxID=2448477 RepID=UPI000FD94CDE|nr:type VI secretion system lipoprotein TssJ [Saccharospirillum alexandrii]